MMYLEKHQGDDKKTKFDVSLRLVQHVLGVRAHTNGLPQSYFVVHSLGDGGLLVFQQATAPVGLPLFSGAKRLCLVNARVVKRRDFPLPFDRRHKSCNGKVRLSLAEVPAAEHTPHTRS